MYKVTTLLSGRTWFVHPNWSAGLSLIQRNHSSSPAMFSIQGVSWVF